MSHPAPTKTSEPQRQSQTGGYSRQPSRPPNSASPYAGILGLQRAAGNRAISRSLGRGRRGAGTIQPKLTVGRSGDAYEQEADRVADTVMRMPDFPGTGSVPMLTRASTESVQRLCTECEAENRKKLRAKENPGQVPTISPAVIAGIEGLGGRGQPLPMSSRAFFESRMGVDLSQVRVHTNVHTAGTAQALNARAFTLGRDVVFGPGQYAPETPSGQMLLAHELVHVVQQGGGTAALGSRNDRGTANGANPASAVPGARAVSSAQNAGIQRDEASPRIGATVADYWATVPRPIKGVAVDYVIDLAIENVDTFPGKEIVGPLWIFFKEGLLGFFVKLKSTATDVKVHVIDKIAAIFSGKDKAFTWAFLKGLLKGFFVDGALGIFKAIWDLIKGLGAVWDFLKDIGRSIGGYPERIRSLLQDFDNRARDIINGIEPAIEELKKTYLDPGQAGSLSNLIVEKGKAFAKQGGEKIAESLLNFFAKPEASAEIGETAGDLLGMALWEVVFAAITAGAGAAVTAIKEGTGTIAKILAKVIGGVLKVVEEIKLFFGKVVDIVKEAVAFVKGKLSELGGKLMKLLEDAGEFLTTLLRACVEKSPVKCNLKGGPRLLGRAGEVSRFEEVKKFPGRFTQLFPDPVVRQRIYARLESGDLSLRDFAKILGRDGAEQVYLRTPQGGRYIDHVFLEGDWVVLRESKNVADFAVTAEVNTQLAKDMALLERYPEAVVHWRISGNGRITEGGYDLLEAMVEKTGGRFRFQLQDSAIPSFAPTTRPPTIH